MPVKLKNAQGEAISLVEHKSKEGFVEKKLDSAERVGEPVQSVAVATIGLKTGATIRTADFENMRVDISLELPFGVDPNLDPSEVSSLLNAKYAFVKKWVEERMDAEVTSIYESIKKN